MRTLLVTAVRAERTAALAALGPAVERQIGPYDAEQVQAPCGEVVAVFGGVGPASAAAVTAAALALDSYDLVVNVGVAGGFRGTPADVGTVVIADRLVAADLGAWAPDGFLDLSAIGLDGAGAAHVSPVAVSRAVARLRDAGVEVCSGAVLTLSAMTGTDARAAELASAHGAVAEAMEGTGCATAATAFGVPVMEVRTISNLVGDRDREAWELPLALAALTRAVEVLLSEPLL